MLFLDEFSPAHPLTVLMSACLRHWLPLTLLCSTGPRIAMMSLSKTINNPLFYPIVFHAMCYFFFLSTDGKISKQLLKKKSGEFDLESIHSLSLQKLGEKMIDH